MVKIIPYQTLCDYLIRHGICPVQRAVKVTKPRKVNRRRKRDWSETVPPPITTRIIGEG